MYYKVLDEGGRSQVGAKRRWHLPVQHTDGVWKPGAWMPRTQGALELAHNGYHVCEDQQVLDWIGPSLYEAELDGDRIANDNLICVRRVRLLRRLAWNETAARTFAAWCRRKSLGLEEAPQMIEADTDGDEDVWVAAQISARIAAATLAWSAARAAAWYLPGEEAYAAASASGWAKARAAQYRKLCELLEVRA